jgi:hypothetical protein
VKTHFFEVLGAKMGQNGPKLTDLETFSDFWRKKKKKKKKNLSFSNALLPIFRQNIIFQCNFSPFSNKKINFNQFFPHFPTKYQFLTDFSTKIINFECIFSAVISKKSPKMGLGRKF